MVKAMSGYGVPHEGISAVLGIAPKTLRAHYREELDRGHVEANVKVAESLFKKATGDGGQAVTAAIFWMKTRAGWKESLTVESEVTHRFVARLPEMIDVTEEWANQNRPTLQ
tara:strand:+ start:3394 stop:3729 length:336 start_codon:yes stop_codon:yes gene_type:complete